MPKRGIKKMDAVVTGAILGGVVASLYGVKKLKDHKNTDTIEKTTPSPIPQTEKTEKKPGFFARIFRKR